MFSNKFWLLHYKKKQHLTDLLFFSFIYTSDGQLRQFLLQLWLREDDKYKTRVLNGPINALVIFWSATAQNNAPQFNFTAVIKFYETLP